MTALQKKAARLIERVGLRQAAKEIGLGVDTLARFVAGGKAHPGTITQIRLRLGGRS